MSSPANYDLGECPRESVINPIKGEADAFLTLAHAGIFL